MRKASLKWKGKHHTRHNAISRSAKLHLYETWTWHRLKVARTRILTEACWDSELRDAGMSLVKPHELDRPIFRVVHKGKSTWDHALAEDRDPPSPKTRR